MIDSTNPRIMADNIRQLSAAGSGGSTVVPNPEGEATGNLSSLGIDGSKYEIPEYSPVNYSTSEVDTGIKWIDSKPIYRLVKNFSASDIVTETGGGKVDLGEITVDEVINIITLTQKGFNPFPFYEASTVYINYFLSLIDGHLFLRLRYGSAVSSDLAAYFVNSKIIVEYTKPAASTNSTRSTKRK